ncbi:hypothetical protein [Pseudofrankia sp. BMG5.37]|uniref:hypothetical protein n=1 Tax=Pseudofrankia sp. BMG5.37 TaxID=3050035 RepID=UPI00289629C5|nr:hypothetical protein [Pseudofrankia sp. BMG5.37]MDT3440917.1 hypothetical protein [Pseudofrankia sp. BMG5.37]
MATGRGSGRVVGPILAALLVFGVVGLAIIPRLTGGKDGGGQGGKLTDVRILAGSETQAYLTDPDVTKRLEELGYRLRVDTAGSREIVSRTLDDYDIALPSNSPQADQIKHDKAITRPQYVLFFTPIAIATFTKIVKPLTAEGVIKADGNVSYFDMRGYLDLVAADKRWSQLKDNPDYQNSGSVLIKSTDVRTSNSAAVYLAIASYVENGNQVVSDSETAEKLGPKLAKLFTHQGFTDPSTEGPFNDYLSIGITKTPMVMIYESQFRARQIAGDGSIKDGRVLVYPSPTIYAKHTAVPLNDKGDAVAKLLATDPELQRLAVHNGFRTSNATQPAGNSGDGGVAPPPQLANVVEPPIQKISELMIKKIDEAYG